MADTTIVANGLPTGWTIYTQIFDADGAIWDGTAFVPYSVGNWPNYATVTPETPSASGTYVCQFPLSAPPGTYTWTLYKQVAGTPASTDPPVSLASDPAFWDGSEFGGSAASAGQPVQALNQILAQAIGTDKSYDLTLRDSSGAVVSYTGNESLLCKIWSGQDQAVLASPAVAWLTPAAGTVQIKVTASDLANLEAGLYRMEATLSDSGGSVTLIFDGSINLTVAPGVASAPLTYCSFGDLKLYAPQIQNLQDTRTDLEGFLTNRARARTWTNERCLDGYRPNYGRARRYLSADGLSPGPHLRWVTTGPDGAASPTIAELRAAVDRGGLNVTDKLREANARMAVALVFLNQPGRDNPYHQLGTVHQTKAEELLAQAVVEIDLDDPLDGELDVRIGQDVTWLK